MKLARAIFAILPFASTWAQNVVIASGKIADAFTGLPVEGASIVLVQADGTRQMHFTDAGGYYSFEGISPGAAHVEIEAQGFLPFQKTNPDDVAIQIAADHAEHNFKLTPAAAITGRILDWEVGNAYLHLTASLLREDFTDGIRRFVAGGETEGAVRVGTSSVEPDDGSFRFNGLEPGRYIIRAGPARSGPARSGKSEGYVFTFYPGTTEFGDALPVTLAAGETRAVEFKMAKRPLFRASGEVEIEPPGGKPTQGFVTIVAAGDGLPTQTFSAPAMIPGPFVVDDLPAGRYAATTIMLRGDLGASVSFSSVSFAMIRTDLSFTITDHDVDGLRIVPQSRAPKMATAGTFRMETGSPLPAGLSVLFAYPLPGPQPDSIPAAENGDFWLSADPGDYSIQPVLPPAYAVKEIRYGGANYLNALVPMRGETADSSLTIVLSDQPAAVAGMVAGSVVNGEQKSVPAKIVLVPDPLPANFDLRAIRVAKSDREGGFSFTGLAAGGYKAVALTGEDQKRDHDFAILRDKLRKADAFEVRAGQSVSISVIP